MAFQPFSPDEEVRKFRNHLPHWRQAGVTYFVTTRLADSVPQSVLLQWEKEREIWLRVNGFPDGTEVDLMPDDARREYRLRFSKSFHDYLDAGAGACWLRTPGYAAIVEGALRYFDGERYELGDFVVMPNHLHVLVTPRAKNELSAILHSWKRFTGREINKLAGREGTVWQAESFNHIVRSEDQLRGFQKYIADNPVKARLRAGEYLHWRRPQT